MDTGLTLTLLVIAAVIVATVAWLVPRRSADLAEIAAIRERREESRGHRLTVIDGEIAQLARRREQLLGEDR